MDSVNKLNDNEVSAVAEMQRKIDAYEEFIILLFAMIQRKDPTVKCVLHDIDLEEHMTSIWGYIKNKIKQDNEKE